MQTQELHLLVFIPYEAYFLIMALLLAVSLSPVVAWVLVKLGKTNQKYASDQRSEIDMDHYKEKLETFQPEVGVVAELHRQSGHYDIEVENQLSDSHFMEARYICVDRLRGGDLSDVQREMYERYIEVIDSQFANTAN